MCEAVGSVYAKCVGDSSLQRSFHADAATLVGVDGHASQSALCHLADLQVACLYPEGCEVSLEAAVEQIQVGAYLIVPRGLGLVEGFLRNIRLVDCRHTTANQSHYHVHMSGWNIGVAGKEVCQVGFCAGIDGLHHASAELHLQQVAELLHIVSARAIATAHRGIDVASLSEVVLQGYFGQDMQVVVAGLSLQDG